MEKRTEPEGVLRIIREKLLKKMDNLILQGCIENKLVAKTRMMMNGDTFFLPKFLGGSIYPEFPKLLNEANMNTNHVQHNLNTPISIKVSVAIWQ